jgi:hypothetical protein
VTDVFFVPSAIGNNYGSFSFEQRFNQLLGTVQSIKKYSSNADIVIVDCSYDLLSESKIMELTPYILEFFSLHQHPQVIMNRQQTTDPNRFIQKTIGEIISTLTALNYIKNTGKQYRRVFKLSGRFQLDENFNQRDYNNHIGQVVISKKQLWHGRNHYYLRLYSFDFLLLDTFIAMFDKIHLDTSNMIRDKNMLDIIEYSVCHHIVQSNIPTVEVDCLGLEGYYGQDAKFVKE